MRRKSLRRIFKDLKEERQKSKRKSAFENEQPSKKQKTIQDCVKSSTPYGPNDPRQEKITNSVASMICRDGIPTNVVDRPGFQHLMHTMDPRYTLPHPATLSRSIFPKMKNTVDDFLARKITNLLKNGTSVAFSIDGLDAHDVEKSAVYDFSVYFLEGTELHCETLYVKRLESPVTGEALKDFLIDVTSIDAEILRWSGLSSLSRTTNPLHAMDALKSDYPRIFRLFRKYCIFPSTQNRDERIFSLVARNTRPQCR